MAAAKIKVLQETFDELGKGKENGHDGADIEATKSAIRRMLTRTENYQARVRKHVDKNYTDFMSNHTSPDIYMDESQSLQREINDLLETVGDQGLQALNESNNKMAASGRELKELLLGMHVTEHILKIDDLFQCVEDARSSNDHLVVLDLIGRLRSLIFGEASGTPQDVERIFQNLECYDTIKVKYHVQSHLLQQNLQERFDRLVQLNCKSFPNSRCVTLMVSKDEQQLQDIGIALFQERYNPVKLCEFLLNNCIEPLVTKPVSVEFQGNVESIANDENYYQLSLSYSTKTESPTAGQLRPNYKQVLDHIKLLLNTLGGINCSVSQTQHVFSIIGDHIKDRLLELLVHECLIPAVPETMEERQNCTLCDDVVHFEQYLADTFLINPEVDRSLRQFCEQYETYYRNRLFNRVLETVREIIQRDMQDMMPVGHNNQSSGEEADPIIFPRCMISKSVQDFVKLMDRIVRQTADKPSEAGDKSADPLDGLIDLMLGTYVDEVPKIHKKLLESIPQQSVLFHNNCMYLTHWLSQDTNKSASLVQLLRSTGQKHFRIQIDYQISILMEIMSGFVFDSGHTLGTIPLKLVRQCLRQLELIKNVWQNVLAENVYNSSFCELLNAFTSELIRRIFTLRDISATMACELSDLIDVVLDKAPTLFSNKHEVLQVATWMKLQQLKTMMNASLKEITEQWCDGVGPLTANYKPEEIRYLIRALFQDTDRRAKAITQIV
ncbi:centromere/kinetochore protein zw10 [Drosophila tropicalis]|uniref:centromere/kinetochore protein zw10 n=1 Tax=Drosophila tropicalis TaxID=46794 RepID=UPI0035AC286A